MRICTGLLILLWVSSPIYSQCDLEILDVDLIGGSVTIAFNNTENCGGTAGPDGVAEIQFGFQALDSDCNAMNQGWNLPSGFSLSPESNHPGWIYSATSSESGNNWTNLYSDSIDPPYYTGDTVVFPIYNQYQSDCINGQFAYGMYCQVEPVVQYWLDQGLSIQVVIWQVSYGVTMYSADGGWAEVGPNGDGTSSGSGLYEDANFLDNWVVVGPCGDPLPEVIVDTVYIELPPDTVIVVEYDTIPIPINWYFYDTTYIYVADTLYLTEYLTDTIYETEYVYDTTWVDNYIYDTTYVYILDTLLSTEYVYDTTYIYLLDTLHEYIVQELWLDCTTGLPCDDQPGVEECEEMVVFVPNVFTPNNDGVNDSFYAQQSDPSCWYDWSMTVYNRWGGVVFQTDDPEYGWDGSYNGGGHYVPDGVYAWVIKASSYSGRAIGIEGTVQIFR